MISSISLEFAANERLTPLLQTDTEDMDDVMHAAIAPKLLALEPRCAQQRWFPVRDLHPLQATAYFAECFMRAFAKVTELRGRADYRSAPFKTGIKRVVIVEQPPSTLTGLWKARQVADMLTCPYEDFIFMLQMIAEKRGRRYLLTPSQLYQKELQTLFLEQWQHRITTKLLYSDDRYFSVAAFNDEPLQCQHRDFVAAQIQLHPVARQPLLLCAAVFSHSLMSKDFAQFRFPEHYSAAENWAKKMHLLEP